MPVAGVHPAAGVPPVPWVPVLVLLGVLLVLDVVAPAPLPVVAGPAVPVVGAPPLPVPVAAVVEVDWGRDPQAAPRDPRAARARGRARVDSMGASRRPGVGGG